MNKPTDQLPTAVDVVVIGGGVAGLTAAGYAARGGATVLSVEARRQGGGRARSEIRGAFTVNQGAHALYRAGAFRRVLGELGVPWAGRSPRVRGSGWFRDGEWTPWLRGRGAAGGAAGLRALARSIRPAARAEWEGASVADWLAAQPESARAMLWAALRTATYSSDMSSLDAGAGLKQLALAARSVDYVDHGWQSLVDGLRTSATSAGVEWTIGKASAVVPAGGGARVVVDGREVQAGAVVLAPGGLGDATRLVGGASPVLRRWADAAQPQLACCLDVALARVTRRRVATYGLDEPVYFVDHARTARLGPSGSALLHGLYYEPDRSVHSDPLRRLEAVLDAWQPGWREHVVDVVERRRMVVAHDRPTPGRAVEDRPVARVPDLDGVWFAGDAVTGDGLLADAAASSGRAAGMAAAAHARRRVRSTAPGGTVST